MIKNYLLDTNILLQNPQSLFGFEDNNVYLCGTTMQELDSKKTAPGELGYNARECCRILDGLRETGDLTKGVVLHTAAEPKKCGKLYVEPDGVDQGLLPKGFKIDVPDNRILPVFKPGKTARKADRPGHERHFHACQCEYLRASRGRVPQ